MSQNARESLSALMDNEGDDLEMRRVLKSLEEEPDAADAWRRYHLMRSLMRRDHDVDVSTDLSAGIMARLEDEPVPVLEAGTRRSSRAPTFARSAGIAAAVSLMVITGVQFYSGSGYFGSEQPEVAGGGGSSSAPTTDQGASTSSAAGDGGQQVASGLPMFTPSDSRPSGIMPVGAGVEGPLFMAPNPRQSLRADQEQALLLQSYLDRHAEGAAYPSGDAWMPLLRASGSETLGQR